MSTMIQQLEQMAGGDTKVRAILKRSLGFAPGTYPPAFPYVEHRVAQSDHKWVRKAHYLAAGLWALHGRERQTDHVSLAVACARLYLKRDSSASIERRFITLLDADDEQLGYRLRQMLRLLADYAIDFELLLSDLLHWNHPDKFVQVRWAREFYRYSGTAAPEGPTTQEKETQR